MELLQKQIAEWEALNVPPTKRPDFDAFWEATCELARTRPLNVRSKVVPCTHGANSNSSAATFRAEVGSEMDGPRK